MGPGFRLFATGLIRFPFEWFCSGNIPPLGGLRLCRIFCRAVVPVLSVGALRSGHGGVRRGRFLRASAQTMRVARRGGQFRVGRCGCRPFRPRCGKIESGGTGAVPTGGSYGRCVPAHGRGRRAPGDPEVDRIVFIPLEGAVAGLRPAVVSERSERIVLSFEAEHFGEE